MGLVVAIDGPAGSGKSTVAREVARRLGLIYVDTGAMYRALTIKVLESGLSPDETEEVARMAGSVVISFKENRVMLDGRDVTDDLRDAIVDEVVSLISLNPSVRHSMVLAQRRLLEDGGVMEGRDVGTVVAPHADLKVFLIAQPDERARRRHAELPDPAGVSIESVAEEIQRRDWIDTNREISPLKPAEDSILIDSTGRSVEDVAEQIIGELKARG